MYHEQPDGRNCIEKLYANVGTLWNYKQFAEMASFEEWDLVPFLGRTSETADSGKQRLRMLCIMHKWRGNFDGQIRFEARAIRGQVVAGGSSSHSLPEFLQCMIKD